MIGAQHACMRSPQRVAERTCAGTLCALVLYCEGCPWLQGCRHGKEAPKEGWPSLSVIEYSTEVRDLAVNVLGVNSRKPTRAIIPSGEDVPASKAPDVAGDFLGNVCYVKCASHLTHLIERRAASALPSGTDTSAV